MTTPTAVLELHEYLEYLNEHLNVSDERSILATAPQLLALARNKTFLARFLTESLSHLATFQEGNGYTGPVFVLGKGPGFMVRAVAWPAADEESKTPSNLGVHAYDGDAQVAHNHNFSLLTTTYSGPGYETDLYEWDRDENCEIEPSQTIDLRFCGRKQLHQRSVLFYRAFRDVHVQYPPTEYSVSLNLCVYPPEDELRDQHYIDIKNRTALVPGNLGNDRREQLISLARAIGAPSFKRHLRAIAEGHPSLRVRETARQACE